MRSFLLVTAGFSVVVLGSSVAYSATITVGPSGMFQTPCQAFADPSLAEGDTVEVDSAGQYPAESCVLEKNNITVTGTGAGRAKIDITNGMLTQPGNAIWVINGQNAVLKQLEFTGAKAMASNGAALVVNGANININNCYFHDNDFGVRIAKNAASDVLIEFSEFGYNGSPLPGHNIEVGEITKFTLNYSYSHHALEGDLVNSRAETNYILFNRLTDETDGTSRYELGLPAGGTSYVIGNLFHKGNTTALPNNRIIGYADGQGMLQKSLSLFVVNNTFVSEKSPATMFINAASPPDSPPVIRNNIFAGKGTACNVGAAVEMNNLVTEDLAMPMFADAANYNYRLLEGSPAIDKGDAAGMDPVGMYDLSPKRQYLHPLSGEDRPVNGALDQGAYEVPPPASGSGGAGGAGTGGSNPGTGGAGGNGNTGGGSASSSSGGAEPADEGGCGCRTPSTSGTQSGAALSVMAAVLLFFTRRRRTGTPE